jgi:hypothetical protein
MVTDEEASTQVEEEGKGEVGEERRACREDRTVFHTEASWPMKSLRVVVSK